MDSNYFKSVLPFAASVGLKTDNLSGVFKCRRLASLLPDLRRNLQYRQLLHI